MANARILSIAAGALLGLAPRPSAQEPPAQRTQPPPADREQAGRDLEALAERHRGLTTFTARYVQRRTTALLAEPLLTTGELAFRRQPGCVVFRTDPPRAAVVRLDEQVYEVHRPARRRLERFRLAAPDLPRALFAALGGDAAALQADFELVAFARLPAADGTTRHRIELEPRDVGVRERLSRLVLLVATDGGALHAVTYRDPAGDLVEIELVRLQADPEPRPIFALEVPQGTEIVEHAPPGGR